METALDQLIGQMLMVGWQTPNADDLIEDIARYHFGNVILYSRNIKSAGHLADLCGTIQQACMRYNGAPALIAIDQEGGCACRIFDGVTLVPGAMAQASASQSYKGASNAVGRIIGSELSHLGINMDLAPVADVNVNPYNPVIGIRSYSDNPALVSRLASEYAAGLKSSGVLSCYKHFMGQGDVDVDSRVDLPRVKKTLSELDVCEMIPYKVKPMPGAVMVGHALYPELDDRFPAAISKTITKGILRERLHYDGLVLTDCFEMGGLLRTFSLAEAAVFAVNASVDMILVSHRLGRQLTVRSALLSAVKEGDVKMETILNAQRRIAAAKSLVVQAPHGEVDYEKNRRVAERISESSIAIVSGQLFPVDASTVVIGVSGVEAIGVTGRVDPEQEKLFSKDLDVAREIGESFSIPYRTIDNKNFNVSELLSFAQGHKVILCLSDSHLTLIQKVLYSTLMQHHMRVMLISMRTPYDVINQETPECHIVAFEYSTLSIASLLRVLRGAEARGQCPVRMNNIIHSERVEESRNYLVENIVNYIHDNYAKRLTLDNVANEFYISGGHLCKLIKKKLNKNFIDLINEIRINEAKRLLTTTSMRMYEIASLCGFTDINYFTKTFKRYTAMTPTYYRNHAHA